MINIEKAAAWAEATANDNAHGYAQDARWGPDYDCSSFVITALRQAGFTLNATYTGNMRSALLAAGFEDVTAKVNLSTGAGVQRCDVLLNDSSHTALALGGGKIVQASINEKGTVTGGQTGDQTGREIYVRSYYNYPWNVVLRYTAGGTSYGATAAPAETGEEETEMRMLKTGDKGYQVWVLQTLLIARGYSCGETGADSDFGSATKAAVLNFQRANGLEVDGIVGPLTWAKLLPGVIAVKAIINNSTCMIVSRERLTRGTVGKTMEAEFSAEWEGLAITATFEAGDEKRDKIYTGEPIVIPHEVLSTAGVSVLLGFQGAMPDGTIVKRTEKEWLNNVSETLDPAGVPSSEPTPDVVAQIQQAAANAEALARSVREDADLGKFNGGKGEKGDNGGKGDTGPAGEAGGFYTPAVTQPDANTMRVAFSPSKEDMPDVEPKDIILPSGGSGSVAVDSTLTASGKAADAKATGDAIRSLSEEIVTTSESKVAAHNTGTDTHSDIRLLIQGLTDRLNALADSDDTTLDQLSEVVAYIKSNRSLIEAITTSKVSVADIVDNLTTNVSNKPLSAAQGVVIKTLIDALRNDKLDAAELTNAVNTALAQAKASGEFDGADGHTPVKGTDYFTESDKTEMVNAVIAALPVYDGEVLDV